MNYISMILIISILFINFILYKKNKLNKKLFIISSFFIILYSIISILIYYNNFSKGFGDGILLGPVAGNNFCDEERYYFESKILFNHFSNGEFFEWLTHKLPKIEYYTTITQIPGYGNYNFFVVFLAFLRLLGLNTALNLILFKIVFYIPTAIYLYKLARIYLNEKKSLILVIFFSALPGYILCNTLLMRDNIIILLLLIILYYILNKETKLNYLIIIPVSILLFMLRGYLILILLATYIFLFKNDKKLITYKDLLYILVIIITLLFFINYNFDNGLLNIFGFSDSQMSVLQETFIKENGNGLKMLLTVFVKTGIHIIYDPPLLNFLTTGSVYLILLSIGNILGTILSVIFAIKYIYISIKNKDNKLTYLVKFIAYFSLLCGILVFSKDGFIINRVALMWLPLFIIIILIPINKFNKK